MKVKELIRERYLPESQERLERLIELEAPKVVIKGTEGWIKKLTDLTFEVVGHKELLDKEIEEYEVKWEEEDGEVLIINKYIRYAHHADFGPHICMLDKQREDDIARKAVVKFLQGLIKNIEMSEEEKEELECIIGMTDIPGFPHDLVYEDIARTLKRKYIGEPLHKVEEGRARAYKKRRRVNTL